MWILVQIYAIICINCSDSYINATKTALDLPTAVLIDCIYLV